MASRTAASTLNRFRINSSQLRVPCHKYSYHSYDHATTPPFPAAESAILSSALARVPDHGFTTAALELGAHDAGYRDVSINLFPRGVFDMINYHLVMQRLALKDSVQFPAGESNKRISTGAKVKALVLARLRNNGPLIHHWQHAVAVMAQPSYAPTAFAELARLADEIWFLAGDASVDTSWYTKRASLSAIYSSSEMFMTQDTSQDLEETEKFLDSRLQEMQTIGSLAVGLSEWTSYTVHSAVNVLRSKAVRI